MKSDFNFADNQLIYDTIRKTLDESDRVDLLTVVNQLREHSELTIPKDRKTAKEDILESSFAYARYVIKKNEKLSDFISEKIEELVEGLINDIKDEVEYEDELPFKCKYKKK